jgi:hypothetical protein
MRGALQILSLVLILAPCLLFPAGWISHEAVKLCLLAGTAGWMLSLALPRRRPPAGG